MTPDERQLLSGLFDRIRNASTGPKDREAEAYIEDAMRSTPSAGYVLAQTVLVQQQALEAAAKHISELEAQVKSGGDSQPEGSFLGNLGRSLFGGGAQPASSAPPRSYDARQYERDPGPPPGYAQRPAYAPPPPPPPQQGGPWGAPAAAAPQGGGFMQGALQTATGVAGGVLLGNALGGLFGGHGGGMFGGGSGFGAGGFGGGGFGAPHETVNETINNYYESPGSAGQPAQGFLSDTDDQSGGVQDAAYDDSADFDSGGGGGGDDDYA